MIVKYLIFVLALFAAPAWATSPLCGEVTGDPLARGYASMTADEVVTDINTAYRTRNRVSMSGREVWEHTVYSDFQALTTEQKGHWLSMTQGVPDIDPFGNSTRYAVTLFGGGSATITALANARIENITRAEELGLGHVRPGHVNQCRN